MSILLLATQGASAQHADTTAVLRELRIREVGISGSRQTPVRTVMSQTPLFDRKAQAAAPCQTLEAALRNAPSVDIRERGGKGTQADISVRGGSFDQTMVLLNGIDFTDARTGHQSHSLPVDIECISGVELLEGIPGVGAYAGAVNLRPTPLVPQYLLVEGVGGQYGYAYGSLSGAGRFAWGAYVSYRKNFDRYDWTRGTVLNRHNTDNAGAKAWVDCDWAGGTTTLGGDYAFSHIYSTNLGELLATPHGDYLRGKSRHTGNVYLRHSKHWRRFDAAASAGASLTPYGTALLWSLDGGCQPAEGLRVSVGASQSMRLPTFTDLYYSSPAQINNLDLVPEKAVTVRAGARYAKGRWSASATGYYRAGRDIIDWVWHPDDDPVPEWRGKWHSEQTSELDTYGVELTGGYASSEGFLRRATLSYAWITTDRSSELIAKSAMDFLRHKAALAVEVRFLRRMSLALTASVAHRNGSYTHYPVSGDASVTETRDFKPYFLLDARLAWEKGICRLYVDGMNVTDTRYCDMGGIPLPGAWVTGGVVLTIGKR